MESGWKKIRKKQQMKNELHAIKLERRDELNRKKKSIRLKDEAKRNETEERTNINVLCCVELKDGTKLMDYEFVQFDSKIDGAK